MKNGMVKQALSAARMRYIVASLPANLARKKLGNKRYERIRREVDAASERLGSKFSHDDGYATLITPRLKPDAFGDAPFITGTKGRYLSENYLRSSRPDYKLDGEHWREIKRSLFPATELHSHNVVSRDEFLGMLNATNHRIKPEELKHAYYFNIFRDRPMHPGASSASRAMRGGDRAQAGIDSHRRALDIMKELPYYTGGSLRDVRANRMNRVLANEMRHAARGNAAEFIDSKIAYDNVPRSIKSVLRRIDGANLLEEGTSANKLYRRLRNSNNSNITWLFRNATGQWDDSLLRAAEQGDYAAYLPATGSVLVNPKTKHYEHILNHERTHELLNKMPVAERARVTRELVQRLRDVSARNGLNIPWDDAEKMHEAVTEGYRMMRGGVVDPSRTSLPHLPVNAEGMRRIDSLKGASDVEKEMLRQLYANYQHDIFSKATRLSNV